MHVHVGFTQSHILSDANSFAALSYCYSLSRLSVLSGLLFGHQCIGTAVYRYLRICPPALYVAYVLYFHTAYSYMLNPLLSHTAPPLNPSHICHTPSDKLRQS